MMFKFNGVVYRVLEFYADSLIFDGETYFIEKIATTRKPIANKRDDITTKSFTIDIDVNGTIKEFIITNNYDLILERTNKKYKRYSIVNSYDVNFFKDKYFHGKNVESVKKRAVKEYLDYLRNELHLTIKECDQVINNYYWNIHEIENE